MKWVNAEICTEDAHTHTNSQIHPVIREVLFMTCPVTVSYRAKNSTSAKNLPILWPNDDNSNLGVRAISCIMCVCLCVSGYGVCDCVCVLANFLFVGWKKIGKFFH